MTDILGQKHHRVARGFLGQKHHKGCKGLSESFSATILDTHNLGLQLSLQQIMVFLLAAVFSP
jgi:hypothetical protein